MPKRCFIITGTSKGMGEALSRTMLDRGDTVYGISRSEAAETLAQRPGYIHTRFDLMQTAHIDRMLCSILQQIDPDEYEMICLVNNAAMLEPLKLVEDMLPEEVTANIQISLIAPMILTSVFIRDTRGWEIRKKVVQITSGSGSAANPAMSVYSTAKAGLNMFTRCAGTELSDRVEVIAVDPGMVDTPMQAIARNKNAEDFALSVYFEQAYQAGQLKKPDELAEHLARIIDARLESGRVLTYLENE
ncbi:SDR family NAD(P)-dependent oxidoreductase [Paenibacillus sp. KQZ6P-2]|uniref:SDR family NAD(P)-dependent oxidoreductase n=1 Tax=Paenibacillus mangrovi TaxID=2931978 RepID=A0A9X1WTE6_9BACL|nr:SDR family NAD(P)-dependent oxidoreductase [Paenibacillus mangrovi]MCJ8013258.1 SDR family NAD(P)-dependent oxidoreductase [Paenibacillus mangrovi]